MKPLLTIIAILTVATAAAQVHTINNYDDGTRITYYVGECGNDIPEAEGKAHFCDAAGNQAVVENSFGLNSNSIQRMEANFFNDDQVFVTSNGLSIHKEDGSWDNIPNRAAPNSYGDPGQNNKVIREAIYLPDGQIIFHGTNIGSHIVRYDPVTKELSAIALDSQDDNTYPWAIEYDSDRDVVWIMGGPFTDKKLYQMENYVITEVHDLEANVFPSVFFSDPFAYVDDVLWMVSFNSLVKIDLLDGYNETTYDNSTTGLLPFDNVSDMEIDSDGMIWLAQSKQSPADGALTRFNPATDEYTAYQKEVEGPGGYNARFNTIGIDSEGHVWGISNDYSGHYELDASGADPIWTLYANTDFDALDLPYIYNVTFIHTQNGKTYFCTSSASTGSNDQYEILILENGSWSGINDNVEGNFSHRMSNEAYSKVLADAEGGVWWFGQSDGEFLYLKDENDFNFEHSTGYLAPDMCSINADGDLTMRFNSEVGLYEDGVFTPYESIPSQNFNSTASVGSSVWAFQSQAGSDNLLVQYVNGEIQQQQGFEELESHHHFAPLTTGDIIFMRGWGGELSVQRYDHLTENVTLEYTLPIVGTFRGVIAGENGSYWAVTANSLLYFDGSGSDPLVLNEDNTEMNSLNGNVTLFDAVLDTDMNLHVIHGLGRLYTFSPPYDDLQVETLQISGIDGIMPYQSGFQQGYARLSIDAQGDIWFAKGQDQLYELKDDNDAAEFHVDVAVGLEEFGPSTSLWSLRLYPNPGSDYIEFEAEEQLDNVKVRDLLGQVVSAHSLLNSSRIDVGELPPGIYLLELESRDGFTQTVKWVKK